MNRILLLFASILMATGISAHDFTYTYEGLTLTYTVIDEDAKTCRTKEGGIDIDNVITPGNRIYGDLIIPALAKDGETCYSVTGIGNYGFSKGMFPSLRLPESLMEIGEFAFFNCSCPQSLILPESLVKIRKGAFAACYSLTAVTFPVSLIDIEEYSFSYCPALISVKLPESTARIGKSAFTGCYNLSSVTLPSSLTGIGEYAFNIVVNLSSVYYETDIPIDSSPDVFSESTYEHATLFVPLKSVERCRQIHPWCNFKKIRSHKF